MEKLPQNQPLWEIHIIKYPTSHASGNIIFKLHHSFGDGFSLMGALLSCLQRADDPSLPLTFPSVQLNNNKDLDTKLKMFKRVPKLFSTILNTASDFCSSFATSTFLEDDKTPIRSSRQGVEFLPVSIVTMSFSLDHIKQIKTKLGGLSITMGAVSYMGKLRVAVRVEKGFIDPYKFKSYVENAFGMIHKAACGNPPPTN